MEKKCRNGVREGGKMSGEKPSNRAPILRMEDVLELDAIVTPDTNEILQKTVENEDDEDEEGGDETDSDGGDDRFHFENPSSSHVSKTSRLVKKRKKRKLLLSGNGESLKGYDSFLSEEDISETEAMGFNNSSSFVLSDKIEPDAVSELTSGDTCNTVDRFSFDLESIDRKRIELERPKSEPNKKKSKRKECGACNREQNEKTTRPELKRSNSQYKSCESDVSNNDSTYNKYYRSPADVKMIPRKSVDRKFCNCYNRDYGAKKYNNRKYYSKQTSQDHLESVYSRYGQPIG